jgi:pimeloyl-ACP methyl ester carboxylesterase
MPFLQNMTDVIVVDIAYEADINRLCQTIIQQLPEKSIFIGWSLGGMIATRIAASYPESVAALITLATNVQFVANPDWQYGMPATAFTQFYQSYQDNAESTRKRFMGLIAQGDECVRKQKRYLASLICSTNAFPHTDGLAGLALLRDISNVDWMQKIICPALHVLGENDHLVPVTLEDKVPVHQRNQYHIIKGAGHLLHHPSDRIAPILSAFLQGIYCGRI